jgi:multimeric flavodoxin WrbA
MTPRILAFAGSLRNESFNKKLVPIAARAARDAGAEVTVIDLKDFPLPLFDQDLEAGQGMPENGATCGVLQPDGCRCEVMMVARSRVPGHQPVVVAQ